MGVLLRENVLLIFAFAAVTASASWIFTSGSFDVREHLSTATRYESGMVNTKKILVTFVEQQPNCSPIHINLVARHGTRGPTKKRIKQINDFAERIQDWGISSSLAPRWMKDWESAWYGRMVGGEVLQKGEEEMFELAQRIRAKYPEIFKEPYHSDRYMISATQVPRSAASAVAFGMGLFAGEGTLGPGGHKAFSVITDSRTHDTHLRFYESCSAYQDSKAKSGPVVAAAQEDYHRLVALSLKRRYLFNITHEDIPILWFLCKQEAAALDIVDQTCSLFTKEEVEMLEWADDFEVHTLKGYGKSINYRMGIPLLTNVLECMERVIAARRDGHAWNAMEKAHFRVAHAETVIPFICLLGLFLDEGEVQKIMVEAPLEPPPRPPAPRMWKGSAVAPYGANTMVVLHKCSSASKNSTDETEDDFRVQVFHNEVPVTLPGCNGAHFCPFKVFKEQVILPHLKYKYESLCSLQESEKNHDEL